MMRAYEIENVLNDGHDDEKGGDLCQRAEPANSTFFANYQKLLHRVGCRSLLQVTMGGLALTLAITSAKVSTRGKFCLFSWKRHWAPCFSSSRTSKKWYTGCPKKCSNRMLLEPWCTGSIVRGWHHLGLKSIFLVVSY